MSWPGPADTPAPDPGRGASGPQWPPPPPPGGGRPAGPAGRPPARRGFWLLVFLAFLVVAAVIAAIVATHAPAGNPTSTSARTSSGGGPPSIASRIEPGLVDITVTFGLQHGGGAATGMVLTTTGEVLTNNHVIDGATTVKATDLGNGRVYSARVVGYDRRRDVAVLQLNGASRLATVPLGHSATVSVGAAVAAVGNAGGLGGRPSVARGRVIAVGRSITASDEGGGDFEHLTGLLETDADIQPGDSGGPLVDRTIRVIARDAAAAAGSSVHRGFAIPIDAAAAIARRIEAGRGSATVHVGPTAFLGVAIASPRAVGGTTASGGAFSGALVAGVLGGSPAQRAGLAPGAVVTHVDGRAVTSGAGLPDLLVPYHPGDQVSLRWVDQTGAAHTSRLTLAAGPPA